MKKKKFCVNIFFDLLLDLSCTSNSIFIAKYINVLTTKIFLFFFNCIDIVRSQVYAFCLYFVTKLCNFNVV